MQELDLFIQLQNQLQSQFPSFQTYGDFVFTLNENKSKKIELYVSALLHGDEIQGLEVVNHVMRLILDKQLTCDFPLAISLGNPRAAILRQRFVEKDLNRCFAQAPSLSYESQRAQVLLPLAKKSKIILDLHQTVEACETAFFVFPHLEQNISFAKRANQFVTKNLNGSKGLPLVTMAPGGLSVDGKTLVELVEDQGIGIAVELGQKGISEAMRSLGSTLVQHAFHEASHAKSGKKIKEDQKSSLDEIYHITTVIKNKPGLQLVPGLKNFMTLQKGDLIAVTKDQEVRAPNDCKILFPKYGPLAEKSSELVELATLFANEDQARKR